VYAVTVSDGMLHVLGRLEVRQLCSAEEAAEALGTEDLWDADEHLVAKRGTATRTTTTCAVPSEIARKLRLVAVGGRKRAPRFSSRGKLDPQTFRGIRELTQNSAAILDDALARDAESGGPTEEELEFPEGRQVYQAHVRRERNRKVVERAKAQRYERDPELRCEVCGFSFALAYGDLGDGYIEAHHTMPLGKSQGSTKTRVSDLVLVCANCHRMLHRRRPWLDRRQLRALLRR